MSKTINEIGNKYGKLTVIQEVKMLNKSGAYWECQCECGNKIIVRGADLRRGHTKSCGCFQKEKTSKASTKNLIGQTIGNFTVLESIIGVKYNGPSHSWRCRCNLCGREDVIISTHNIYRQYSCGCCILSKGENKISQILNKNKIKYTQEKRFNNCKFKDTNKLARFDFYLPDYNTLIEYDGIQHFYSSNNGKFDNPEKFKLTQQHDQYKNQWCKENHITLIRIPYTHFNNIELKDLLPQTSQFII